ncbi:POU domain, class 6, transcription factor 1-like isoform X2 [Carassius auratus]|uniref:POU domain protein n=1 Tax=Carassius auratus TaxID=7957 RepID=A0A6P6M7Y2_CARAU|nr:POU domain, class 6, transcription factor 1-like isoform X2 [Carassius auratus]XP_026092695.1 POU domain, class 6, transcription factor 1-like isoform X2 [Carassius auratus]
MDTEDLPASNAPLTVNEQVIVMSGQETIRVLEVEVDTALSSSGTDGKGESGGEEATVHILDVAEEAPLDSPVTTNTTTAVSLEVSAPAVQTVVSKAPISVSLAQPQSSLPITVQACPQVLTQDGLASLMTSMLAQQGSLGQPLLIPLSMAGSVGGQGGLAVLTWPTATVATLPGLAAASPAGGLLKLPFAGLQAATVLNSVQTQLQSPAQAVLQPQVSALQPTQTTTATTASVVQKVSEPSASVATLQTAGLSINPAIISAASLGAQPQFISSLTTTPIITSAVSNVTGQLITNAQGQVIGTLPLLFNPAAASALPAQGLQVQTVSPQLFFNSQGQIIATIGNGPTAAAPAATSVLPKATVPLTLTKTTTPGPVGRVAPSKVIIAPQPQVVKSVTSLTSAGAIACGDMPTVGQLVSKPQSAVNEEEAINLEEIREFAKNFKIRRLSLGLTQTQVGQALTATEGPAYSQSAICRFEKLDITPKSAQKLKPVLERWLVEAELWNQKGQQNLMDFVGGEPSKKRKRRTSFTPQAIEVLNTYFEKNSLPTGQEITEIAKELNYDREVVRVWFCNRRQTLKNTSKINVFQAQ